MRIIGDIPHPRMKISIFRMNDKLSIKFEKDLIEQIIKFRDGSAMNNVEKLKETVGPSLMQMIEKQIDTLVKVRFEMEPKEDQLEEFDEII